MKLFRGTLTSLRWFTPNRSFVFQALWTGVLQAGVYPPISRLERINDQWSAHFSFCDVLQLIRPFLNQNSQSKLLFLFVPGAEPALIIISSASCILDEVFLMTQVLKAPEEFVLYCFRLVYLFWKNLIPCDSCSVWKVQVQQLAQRLELMTIIQ